MATFEAHNTLEILSYKLMLGDLGTQKEIYSFHLSLIGNS